MDRPTDSVNTDPVLIIENVSAKQEPELIAENVSAKQDPELIAENVTVKGDPELIAENVPVNQDPVLIENVPVNQNPKPILENIPVHRSEIQVKLDFLSGKNVLVFDLETTGFPTRKPGFNTGRNQYYDYQNNTKYESSRIVQIAWTLIENFDFDKLEDIDINCYIRKPINFHEIPPVVVAIHGISYQQAVDEGIILSEILNKKNLKNDLLKCDYIMAHNVWFDVLILLNELNRIKFTKCVNKMNQLVINNKMICTGEYSRDICKMPMKYGIEYKMPQLRELYKFYYGDFPPNSHDAKHDVNAIIKILKYQPVNNEKN